MIDYTVPSADAVTAAQGETIATANAIVEGIIETPAGARTFEDTLGRLEDVFDLLEQAQGRYGFMSYVAPQDDVRAAADTLREALEKYEVELGFNEALYNAVLDYSRTDEAKHLTGERQRLLEWSLRDYRRDGFDLAPEQRQRVRELKNRLVELGVAFQRNIDLL